jgi:hypothetical protein
MYQPKNELRQINRQQFRTIDDTHWQIESFHRVIKQVCNVERFQVRTESGIRTHCYLKKPLAITYFLLPIS